MPFLRDDTPGELDVVRREALASGAYDAALSNHWSQGGEGAIDLAAAVRKACRLPCNFRYLYDLEVRSKMAWAVCRWWHQLTHVGLCCLSHFIVTSYYDVSTDIDRNSRPYGVRNGGVKKSESR